MVGIREFERTHHSSSGVVEVTRILSIEVTVKGTTLEEARKEAIEREQKILQYVKRLK
jgi:uncharacterized protein YggE